MNVQVAGKTCLFGAFKIVRLKIIEDALMFGLLFLFPSNENYKSAGKAVKVYLIK